MSQVKWVQKYNLRDGPQPIETGPVTFIPVIPLADLAEVVEGLRALDRMCAAHKIQDVDAHAVIYKLLTQLEAQTKGGA